MSGEDHEEDSKLGADSGSIDQNPQPVRNDVVVKIGLVGDAQVLFTGYFMENKLQVRK